MIESNDVLSLMKIVYVIYVTVVFSLIGMYGFRITSPGKITSKGKSIFYIWIGLLICTGVGIHVLTFNKIPWVKWDLSRDKTEVDQELKIAIADYEFQLPGEPLVIEEGQMVRFDLESRDYTYGFGLFREDGTMVFQMQVVPGHENNIVWKFDKPATYTIRSTEYSGPKGGNLFVKDAVTVVPGRTLAQLDTESKTLQN